MKVREGEIYGFLGPNGAGKTTIMRMMLNLVKPTAGTISMSGEVVDGKSAYLKEIGSIIADTIGVIQEGRLISEVRMEELKEGSRSGYIIGVKDAGTASQILSEVGRVERVDDRTIIVFNSVLSRHELNRLLVVGGVEVERIERKESNLEDYFINLLKEGKRHA
ncbi:ATP-binding cassette domain-containing protein [Rossellomorea marisflavi]|uniref:ATP-binding cassette domain-containing protein n=1 Tax=Rossellomorea marisflavi TaxID=189381 RepID=UPI00203F7864|nr:ATP-binding cassette domain-containing protein [Rossellomorea marisflavi]MCM2603181.1 ATP-binding cassette domain-containing protein [Rossellomorea marisflavi]